MDCPRESSSPPIRREKQRLEINRMETLGEFAAAAERRALQPAAEDDNVFLLARQGDWNAVMAATNPPLRKELKNLGAGIVRAYALWALGQTEAAREAAAQSLEEDRRYHDADEGEGHPGARVVLAHGGRPANLGPRRGGSRAARTMGQVERGRGGLLSFGPMVAATFPAECRLRRSPWSGCERGMT